MQPYWRGVLVSASKVRQQLGKHSSGLNHSMVGFLYRSSMAALAHVATMIQAMEAGRFDPDAS
eukprot:6492575-Amphidinium_carterae.1